MTTLLLTFTLFFAVVVVTAGLSLVTGRFLKGSCGGVAGGDCLCRSEGKFPGTCEYEGNAQLPVAGDPSEP